MRSLTPRPFAVLTILLALRAAPSPAQDSEWRTDFSRHSVPLDEIVSGGPPKDGIPPIDRPRFASVTEADEWLGDREPVIVVQLNGATTVYPIQILMWHEIVNDVVGGTPVVVTYCPLCNTALAFDREVDGQILDFGTTGRLRHSDLVMYDRQTESWWQQAVGEAIVGRHTGTRLAPIPAPLVSWRALKLAHPGARVLSRETGHDRQYGENPYRRYDEREGPIAGFFRGRRDPRLPAMERVVALEAGGEARAYPFSALAVRRVVHDQAGELALAVFWSPGTASALDADRIADGRDVGSGAVFDRRSSAGVLEFSPAGDGRFRDRQTGSVWDELGRAVSGPLAGTQLAPVPHSNPFWFAWVVFRPDTRIVR